MLAISRISDFEAGETPRQQKINEEEDNKNNENNNNQNENDII